MTASDAMPPVFEGLKVVDAASWIAAPASATILADLGAEVVKVELPGSGDPYRELSKAPGTPKSAHNYCWMVDARNKRSLTINLKSPDGRGVLRRLVEWCDVYVTNHPLPMRRALGLTYEDLAPFNPRMIFASLTAYGERGGEADREGFDNVAYWARSGLADLVRSPGAKPVTAVPGMGDHPTGVSLYAAIVTALYRRERTGLGGLVHTSLLANGYWANACLAQAALVDADFSAFSAARSNPEYNFTRAAYECSDGRFVQMLMVRSEAERLQALRAICPDTCSDDRFRDPVRRLENSGELARLLEAAFATAPAAVWLDRLHDAGVLANLVATVGDLGSDAQAIANAVLVPSGDRGEGHWIVNHPVRIEGSPSAPLARAPAIGEHTEQILSDLGYMPDEIMALRRTRAV